jgi:hypothetical protein
VQKAFPLRAAATGLEQSFCSKPRAGSPPPARKLAHSARSHGLVGFAK